MNACNLSMKTNMFRILGNGEIDFNEYIHLMENDTCGWLGMIFPNEQAMVDFCFAVKLHYYFLFTQ